MNTFGSDRASELALHPTVKPLDLVADAILDWIDKDDEAREFGAESDYYNAQTPPYSAKNGPLDTIGP